MAKKKAVRKAKKVGIVMTIEIDTNINGCYFWRQRARNGKVLSSSEAYSTHSECCYTASKVAAQSGVVVVEVWRL